MRTPHLNNKPEWMLGYFRQKVATIVAENSEANAIEELAKLLTHYALMPPEVAKEEVQED